MATIGQQRCSRVTGTEARRSRKAVLPVFCGKSLFSSRPRSPLHKQGVRHAAAVVTAPGPVSQRFAQVADFKGVHHVALLCSNLERALEFYQGILGLEINPERPHSKLPYRGAWLWIGPEMIHLMELPNPDPLTGRPEHGGRDRHFCVGVASIEPLVEKLEAAGVAYTKSMSGRAALFFRDPDMNCLECVEMESWR